MPSYEDPESYWDSVIESEERYRAVGNRGLPDSFNKARKENLIPRLKQIGEEHVGGFSGKKYWMRVAEQGYIQSFMITKEVSYLASIFQKKRSQISKKEISLVSSNKVH